MSQCHKISENGMEFEPEKKAAVTKMKVQAYLKELRAILGIIGFYR